MSSFKPLRVWPGAVFGTLAGLLWFALPAVSSDATIVGMIGGFVCSLAVFLWWLFFSRAPWSERLGVIALMVLAVAVTYRLVDASIAGGMMGFMLIVYSLPVQAAALGAAVFLSRYADDRRTARLACDWRGDGVRTVHRAAVGWHSGRLRAVQVAMDADCRGSAARED